MSEALAVPLLTLAVLLIYHAREMAGLVGVISDALRCAVVGLVGPTRRDGPFRYVGIAGVTLLAWRKAAHRSRLRCAAPPRPERRATLANLSAPLDHVIALGVLKAPAGTVRSSRAVRAAGSCGAHVMHQLHLVPGARAGTRHRLCLTSRGAAGIKTVHRRAHLHRPGHPRKRRPGPTPPAAQRKPVAKTAQGTTASFPSANTVTSDHLSTLDRQTISRPANQTPTPTQRRAFELLGAPVPLTLQ